MSVTLSINLPLFLFLVPILILFDLIFLNLKYCKPASHRTVRNGALSGSAPNHLSQYIGVKIKNWSDES